MASKLEKIVIPFNRGDVVRLKTDLIKDIVDRHGANHFDVIDFVKDHNVLDISDECIEISKDKWVEHKFFELVKAKNNNKHDEVWKLTTEDGDELIFNFNSQSKMVDMVYQGKVKLEHLIELGITAKEFFEHKKATNGRKPTRKSKTNV